MFFSDVKVPSTYILADNPKKLAWLSDQLLNSAEFAFDIETNYPTGVNKKKGLPPDYVELVAGISFAWGRTQLVTPWKPGNAVYVPLIKSDDTPFWGKRQHSVLDTLRKILENDIPKVAHNGKFDVRKLAILEAFRTRGLLFDTMLAHALLDEEKLVSSHALKSDFSIDGKRIKIGIADAYLDANASLFKGDLKDALRFYDPQMKRYSKVPLKTLYPYACADADLTLSLKYAFWPLLEEEKLLPIMQDLIMPLQHALMLMELHGVPLDLGRAREVLGETAATMQECEEPIFKMCGTKFNLGSPKQLGVMLFETLGLPGGKKDKVTHQWVTNSEALKALNHPLSEPLLKFRRAQQIHGLYAEPALKKVVEVTNEGYLGWVHPEYWMDSVTGRLKLTDPNLTTLPRPENGGLVVKSMWCADDEHRFIFKDFSQVELRVAAHISREPVWIEGFHADHDMHAAMAARIWHPHLTPEQVKEHHGADRSKAKTVNFGIIYGQTLYSLSQRLGITYEEADTLVNVDYFGAAPVLRQWIEDTHTFVRKYGYMNNIFGRRRHLPDAQLHIPESVPMPSWDDRPSCYRKGPYATWLGMEPQDLYTIDTQTLRSHLKSQKGYAHCNNCSHLHSCVINREVKFVKGKVERAFRQSVNSPIQGSAVDMASMALCTISQQLQQYDLPAAPILHIHDELVVYSHVSCVDQVCAIMDEAMTSDLVRRTDFLVPLKVDTEIVQRWSDKHSKE